MPGGKLSTVVAAPSADVFTLIHNYQLRLEWDTLLQH